MAGLVFDRAVVIHACMTGVRFCRCAPSRVRRLVFWRRVWTGWFCVPVCCGVRFCGTGRGKKSVSSVFSCSPGTTGHSAGGRLFRRRWMAGSELSLITDQFQLEKSPVWCWTGKSDCGWAPGAGFVPCSPGVSAGPCPAYLARELAEAVWVFCGVGKKSNRIEQNFEQVRWRPRRRPGCSGRR